MDQISLHPRLTPLKSDIIDWQRTFCRDSIYAGLSDAEALDVMQEVQDMCAGYDPVVELQLMEKLRNVTEESLQDPRRSPHADAIRFYCIKEGTVNKA